MNNVDNSKVYRFTHNMALRRLKFRVGNSTLQAVRYEEFSISSLHLYLTLSDSRRAKDIQT